MDLRILFFLLLYYLMWGSVILFGGTALVGYSSNYNTTLNASAVGPSENAPVGLFSSGISFGRFVTLLLFGIGLGADAPGWFALLFAMWQSSLTVFSIGWFISSLWNG